MRIAVSNLAFAADLGPDWFLELAKAGVQGVEFAATRIAPWSELTPALLASTRVKLEAAGLSIPSLQAIFFGVQGAALLGDASAFEIMLSHMERVGAVGAALGAGIAVLGAPRQRARGTRPAEEAFDLGASRLRALAEVADRHGLAIGLEPVPSAYGGDFLETWYEVQAMVRTVNHPGLGIHLDTACVHLGGDRIEDAILGCGSMLRHFHIAEPKLVGFRAPVMDHVRAASALRKAGYVGWLAIEMLQQPDHEAAVLEAVDFAVVTYGNDVFTNSDGVEAAIAVKGRLEQSGLGGTVGGGSQRFWGPRSV